MGDYLSQRRLGSPPVRADRQQPFLGIHAVNVFVRNQDESVRFYVEQLGFDVAFDARLHSGERWVAVSPPDGSAVLALIAPAPESKEYRLIGRPTGIVFITEDVVGTFERWRRRGVHFLFTPRLRRVRYDHAPAPAFATGDQQPPVWGEVFTRFKDLDGNSFALAGFDEVNRKIEAHRRRIAEKQQAELRAAQELEIAKQVQFRLFPQRLPPMETLDYAGACIQARQVGGDYYDFLDLGRERFGLVIADVAGKGMGAALLMANLQANLRSQCAMALEEPERLLRSVNQLFYENTHDSAYATMFFAEYDGRTHRLRYANCGHLSGLLVRQEGAVEKLDSTSTVLGLFQDWDCSLRECLLCPGDTFAMYTDGVTESFNAADEEFGEKRLIDALRRHAQEAPREVIASVVEEVRTFSPAEQSDDVTLIVAKCKS
jgi:serine phosphatase RsbU (regulator of sigma subunit)